jgi:transposase
MAASGAKQSFARKPGTVVSEVARRHGLAPQQLFTWRRQARQPAGADAATKVPQFVSAVVEPALREGAVRRQQRQRARPVDRASGIIEVEIEGVSVRVGRGADAKTVAVVIRVLKAGT